MMVVCTEVTVTVIGLAASLRQNLTDSHTWSATHLHSPLYSQPYMVMANLLYGTCKPHVMDIKIGQRTFQEDEVTNQKTRMDLLKKMMDVDPNEPTEEEKVPVTVA